MVDSKRSGTTTRRDMLQALILAAAAVPLGCGTGESAAATVDATGDSLVALPCKPVGQGAVITLGPLSGGVTDARIGLAVRVSAAAKVQFELTAAGLAPVRTACTIAKADEDFAVTLAATGLPAGMTFTVTPLLDDVPLPAQSIQAHTFPKAGAQAAFSFCFGSCQKHGADETKPGPSAGKPFERIAELAETPMFFAQIGDWTYPDYLYAAKATAAGKGAAGFGGLDSDGNNYTVFPEELRQSWHRRLESAYPMRKVLQKTPVAHVWDDHDFAQNNAHRDVTGQQADRVAAFARYLPTYPLPVSQAGVWQQFTCGHVEFWLVDMRSQRTDQGKAVVKSTDAAGNATVAFAEPAGHTMLGAEQLAWLVGGLKASKALWKVVFFPVEVNPLYDIILNKGLELNLALVIEAAADGWCGFPSERKKILDLHKSGEVKNLLFLTGDSHFAAMRERDAECAPVFMSANLDIGQAPIMDLVESVGEVPRAAIWPLWTQDGSGVGSYGRVQVVTTPKHELWCDAVDLDGTLLKRMVVPLQG